MTGTPEGQPIALDDVAAIEAMPVESVLLCRVDEVFQLKAGPMGAAWFALGYGDVIWPAAQVAVWGPLLVLYNPTQDHPSLEVV